MRLARFENSGPGLGVVSGGDPGVDLLRDVTPALDVLPALPLPAAWRRPAHRESLCHFRSHPNPVAVSTGDSAVRRHAARPVANPGKIVAAPVNYAKHLDEVRGDEGLHHQNQITTIHKAGLFLKATSALVGAGEGIALRKLERRNDHEIELAFVIGRTAQSVSRRDALDYVAGYAIGLDITIRGSEERSLRKSADSYAVLGPWLTTADEVGSPDDLELRLSVNGELRQCARTSQLITQGGRADRIRVVVFYAVSRATSSSPAHRKASARSIRATSIDAAIERVGSMRVHVRAA